MTASVAWPIASAKGVRTYNPAMQTAQSVDVAVVEVGGGENEFAGLHHGARFALGRVVHAIGFLAHKMGA